MKKQEEESQKNKFDFAWGNPYFLLEILDRMTGTVIKHQDLKNMVYAPDEGLEELVTMTRNAIVASSGLLYRYVIITAGATQAINSILKYRHAHRGYKAVVTPEYGYPFYNDMIKNSGMVRLMDKEVFSPDKAYSPNPMFLVDSPSNPLGIQFSGNEKEAGRTIWDAVYHNHIYTEDLKTYPKHICMVGSYSKLLGVTGARVGWIATNDIFFYERIRDVSLKDNATVSIPSQKLIVEILDRVELPKFMKFGKDSLDLNRENFQKIEYLFDGKPVPSTGMFYCAHAEEKALKTLEKCGIKYVNLGDNFIRLSMGQTNSITKEGIQTLLKEDGK